MLIATTIQPRRDGTVKVDAAGGEKYVFASNAEGDLVCDVTNEGHAAWLLTMGHFYPYAEDADEEFVSDMPPPMMADSLDMLLNGLDKSGLIDYARQHDIDGIDGRMSVATMRAKITEAMNG